MNRKLLMIGSCLSASTASTLRSSRMISGIYHHLRSDFIRSVLAGEDVGIPDDKAEELEAILVRDASKGIPPGMIRTRVRAQLKSKLARLKPLLQSADVILLDTNYDFARKRSRVSHCGRVYNLSNINVQAEYCENSGFLSLEEAKDSIGRLIETILGLNPSVRIVFLNYPCTGFRKRGDANSKLRVDLVVGISEWLSSLNDKGLLPSQLVAVDCPDVPEHLLSPKGVLYFEQPLYDAFASVVDAVIEGRWNGPGYVGGYERLSELVRQLAPQRVEAASSANLALSSNPYADLPDRQYWKPAVADPYPLAIAGLYDKRFPISREDAVATCGSCFAQHIGKRLAARGYNYMDMEPAPAGLAAGKAASLGYGIYSARYGNVYTSRQLLQLFRRAFGEVSYDEVWKNAEGRYVDPFRPNLCGDGWERPEDVIAAQVEHLTSVRRMFEQLDVFVFTMGLTETWVNRKTGATYPICPGVTAGEYDPATHAFVNLDYQTILSEMEEFLAALGKVNPKARVMLTVSPVPLTATAEARHVLVSTMASKSILRAVADQIYRTFEHVDYFPSYDIIQSPPYRGMFFKSNLRSIHNEGVDHVMSHFFAQHVLGDAAATGSAEVDDEIFCDESFLALARKEM